MQVKNNLIDTLIQYLHRLPGVGPKMAERIAYHIIRLSKDDAEQLCHAIMDARQGIRTCAICFNLTEEDPCHICSDLSRDKTVICVVEHPKDVTAIERSNGFKGMYHVLHGALSPLDGVGPDDLKIDELLKRIKQSTFNEIICATNTNVEGEATALYLSKILKPYRIKITRIAQGIPFGGELEYTDHGTLIKALENRREML